MNKRILIIILVFFVLLGIILIVSRSEKGKVIEEQMLTVEDYSNTVLDVLKSAEEDYTNAIAVSTVYKRSDFYNETRMNMYSTDGSVLIVEASILSANSIKIYNSEGKEQGEFPETNYDDEKVEIASPLELIEGKYYLIKYRPYEERYSYYYISQLTNIGFQKLQLYVVTDGETSETVE